MSAIVRAMYVATQSANVQEEALGKLVDKKESQLEQTKKLNRAMDALESARQDGDGHDTKNFTAGEHQAVSALARDAGVDVNPELSSFDAVHADGQWGGNAWVESDDEEDNATWVKGRTDGLDAAGKKLQRAMEEQQDATGMLDFKMNLAMNDLSKALQDAQGTQQINASIKNALIPRPA